jgi:A/G-specific adenine glycosylase
MIRNRKPGAARQSPEIWDRKKIRLFQQRILHWYGRHRRELPWRKDTLPYPTWVAEVMLQQTQVKTVIPYYERFLKEFPDLGCLGRATEGEVLSVWAGLGYYARARNLHRAARRLVDNYGGEFPGTMREFQNLPGVGRYTAGAVYSIAFNQPQPVVDGNVRRVIHRLHALAESRPENFYWEQAAVWMPEGKASTFNQAVMELGALICVPSRPECRQCPVRALCITGNKGLQAQSPSAKPKPNAEAIHLVVLVLLKEGSILLTTDRPAAFIPGIWGLPHGLLARGADAEKEARDLAIRILKQPLPLERRTAFRHAITFRRLRAHVFCGNLNKDRQGPANSTKLRWVPVDDLSRWAMSSLYQKALHAATAGKRGGKEAARMGDQRSCWNSGARPFDPAGSHSCSRQTSSSALH